MKSLFRCNLTREWWEKPSKWWMPCGGDWVSHEKRLRCSFSCQDTGSPLDYLKIAADQPLLLAYSREKGHSRKLSAADPHKAGVSWRKRAWWRERRTTLGERVCKRNLWKLLFILKFFLMMWELSDNHFSRCHGIMIKCGWSRKVWAWGGGCSVCKSDGMFMYGKCQYTIVRN